MLKRVTYILLLLLLVTAPASFRPADGASGQRKATQDPLSTTYRTFKARSGDTLRKMAQRLRVPLDELVRINGVGADERLLRGARIRVSIHSANGNETGAKVVGKRITLSDGYSFEADEVWKDGDEIWFRKGQMSQRVGGPVRSIQAIVELPPNLPAKDNPANDKIEQAPIATIWIHLNGGARFRVDDLQETNEGAWYSRGNLSVFLERERIARIEREMPSSGVAASRSHDWTSGNAGIDHLIKSNGARYGVDPYLIFLVIEHESHFRNRAVSPKGARGLMQLMPATARRFGIRDSFDPAQNIMGGSRYLKELMSMFGGRVDLALASYNAGEGAVLKFGRTVPPYKETRNYVKRITKRYGQQENAHPKSGQPHEGSIAQ